jgi:parvulin-like peptidyl-prolyl isomerase
LKPGQHSRPYQTQDGWVIFRVRARRPGEIQSLTDVDIDIRKIMFQKKFNELLDETIGILKENSDIQYNRKALETYFEDES